MVQVLVNLTDNANRTVEIVKATYGLRNKAEVIDLIIEKYGEKVFEHQLKPEYVEKIRRIKKNGKYKKVKNLDKYFDDF